jgi:hypothetical protein
VHAVAAVVRWVEVVGCSWVAQHGVRVELAIDAGRRKQAEVDGVTTLITRRLSASASVKIV